MTDRELDALVAEKVMGCSPVFQKLGGWPEVGLRCGCEGHPHADRDEEGDLIGLWKPYSTSIEAAWEVVEKLHLQVSPHEDGKRWIAQWGKFDWVSADTAPRAICLAALRSVGVEVPA